MNEIHRSTLAELFAGVGEPTKGGLVIHDTEVAYMLLQEALLMSVAPPCTIDECEACNMMHSLWWDWCNSLSGPVRVRMQKLMRQSQVPLPPGPWEEVPTRAVPTALN